MILDELFVTSSISWRIKVLEMLRRRLGKPSTTRYRHPQYGLCSDHFITLVYLEECLGLPAHQDELHNV